MCIRDSPISVVAVNDHLIDVGPEVLVARSDEEAGSVPAYRLVLVDRHLDPFGAGVVRALADPVAARNDDAEAVIDLFHPLIDLAKQGMILHRASFAVALSLRVM